MTTWQLKVLTSMGNDKIEWHHFFDRLEEKTKDLHYLPEYTHIYEHTYGQKGFLVVFGDDEDFILMPFMKRPVENLQFVKESSQTGIENLSDIVNAYGYGGPLAKITHADVTARLFKEFFRVFSEYCKNNGIVCEFASLHPLLENHQPLIEHKIINPIQRKRIVYFDLDKEVTELWKGLSRGNQSSINKARQKGVIISRENVSGNALIEFKKLYAETMQRHNAHKKWIFPEDYFSNCAEDLGHDHVSLFCARLNDVIIAEYLILHAHQTAYYHFGGSLEAYFDVRANNLLIYEIALWAKQQGFRWFHLGGGLQNDDSLHKFKTGFSKNEKWFYTYNRIFDLERYSYLCMLKNKWDEKENIISTDTGFFPAYRS